MFLLSFSSLLHRPSSEQHQNLALMSLSAIVRMLMLCLNTPGSMSTLVLHWASIYVHSTVIRITSCETLQWLLCLFWAKVKCLAGLQSGLIPSLTDCNEASSSGTVLSIWDFQTLDPSLLLLCLSPSIIHSLSSGHHG